MLGLILLPFLLTYAMLRLLYPCSKCCSTSAADGPSGPDGEHGDDIVVFYPMRVTDGIEPSDDPVLHFRTLAYSASVKLRTGVDRGPEAPHV